MPPTPLDRRYDAQVRGVWTSVLGRVGRHWSGLRSWRGSDVAGFQRAALPILAAGQRQVAGLTTTYLERLYQEIADDSARVDLDFDAVSGAAIRNGTEPVDVYERPFKEVWTALSRGESLDVAVDRGMHRLETLVKTDLQLTRTHTARDVADEMPGVTYTVREPIGEYNCALCLIASTQRYHKRVLLPIHPGCDCLVKLVHADYDPGQVIDEDKLAAIHAAVEGATGRSDRGGRAVDYRKLIVQHDHGEIGPVLGFKGQRFTGPDDLRNRDDVSPAGSASEPGQPKLTNDPPSGALGTSITGVDPATPEGVIMRQTMNAIASVHRVGQGMPEIPFEREERDGYLGAYVYDTVGNARRFRLAPDGAWPLLTVAHELGHFLDHKGIGLTGDTFASETETGPGGLLHEWWITVQETAVFQVLQFMGAHPEGMVWSRIQKPDGTIEDFMVNAKHVAYLKSPAETFARCYAQWIARRSGDGDLMAQLERASDPGLGATLISGFTPGYPRQWADEDFEPVAEVLDRLFAQLGLLVDEGDDDGSNQ